MTTDLVLFLAALICLLVACAAVAHGLFQKRRQRAE